MAIKVTILLLLLLLVPESQCW